MKQLFKNNNLLILFLIFIVSVPAIYSLLHVGYFLSDDGEWMVVRFSAFYDALRDGQFPVRFLGRLNHGYGYPVANFLYPGFMYLGIPIHVLGFSFIDTIKIIFGLSMTGSAIFSFLWLKSLFGNSSSFLGAVFYLYTPYHLFDLYKRGSVGEVLALSVVPFILWQIERKNYFWICIALALLILSHNTLAVLFLPIIFLYALIRRENKKIESIIYRYTGILVISLGLSAFFWIPAVFELPYTQFSSIEISDFRNYFVEADLVGISSLIAIYFSAFLFIYKIEILKKTNIRYLLFSFFMILGVISIVFSSKAGLFIWNIFPSSFFQFPFRFLSYLILAVSFLSAYIISSLKNWKKIIVFFILFISLIYSSYSYLSPSEFFDKPVSLYSTNEDTTTVKQEYLPKWIKIKPEEHFENKVEILNGDVNFEDLVFNSKKISFDAQAVSDSKIRINTIYYPGWNAMVNKKTINIDYSNDKGLMDISLKAGENSVEIFFSETPLRLFADMISIFSFIFLLFFLKFGKTVIKSKFLHL